MQRTRRPDAIGILTSRIGRRFVALFTGCALLPLVAFAWLSVTRATQQMANDLRASLHGAAKTAGMGIAARLSLVAGDLSLAREFEQQRALVGPGDLEAALQRQVEDRCAAVWVVAPDGTRRLCGGQPVPLLPLSQKDVAHLAAGKPLLRSIGGASQLIMLAALDPDDPAAGTIAASLRADWFWDPEELRSAGSEFAAFDGAWQLLFHTFAELPAATPLIDAASAQPSSGTVEWHANGELHFARYWRAFLMPQYHFDMYVVQSRSQREAFAMRDSFSRWFLLTAVSTLLLVLFASLVQMRRTLNPIVSLHEATRRVARGDLTARVSIRSHDEFGDLGAAFNDMTAQLQENIRRRELTERELVASRDAALAAARAKAEFVTNVSHEFRTPMTEILSATEILGGLDGVDDAAREEFTRIALAGARRMARLVDDVIEVGASTAWSMTPIDVAATITAAVEMMPLELRQRIRTQIATDLPQVLGNADRLREAWCRLLDNAGKFSEPDQAIDVRATCAEGSVVVEIADQGVGISRLDLDRIFEPFCQVGRDQLLDKARGTGLGLTLAKKAVENHGGRIEVDSELGNGATFRVVLPAAVTTTVG